MPIPRPTCLHDHNHQAARHPPCVTPLLPYYARHHGKTSGPAAPEGTGGRQPTMRPDASDRTEYQPVHPFDYACRPRLRTRLTRGRRTWPRNPRSSSARDRTPRLVTHVCILTSPRSTTVSTAASPPGERSPTQPARIPVAASSVVCLSPATLSARDH